MAGPRRIPLADQWAIEREIYNQASATAEAQAAPVDGDGELPASRSARPTMTAKPSPDLPHGHLYPIATSGNPRKPRPAR